MLVTGLIEIALWISVKKQPFSDSALLLLQLLSFGANFCCPATTVVELFSYAQEKISVPLLPQGQNVSHQTEVLLFCYHNCRMFLTTEHSAPLLLQLQNVKKHSATVVAETFGNRGSRTPEFFSGVRIFFFYGCRRAELLSSEKHSALVVEHILN